MDHRTTVSAGNGTAVFIVAIEKGVHNAVTSGVSKEFASVTYKTTRGYAELYTAVCTVVYGGHIAHFRFSAAKLFNNGTCIFFGNVNNNNFVRLKSFSAFFFENNLRFGNLKLVTFTAHGFDKNGKVKLTTT